MISCIYSLHPPYPYLHLHHTGSQEVTPNPVPAESEEQAQEVQVEEEVTEEELQECPDHRPSSFEKGKPRSILPYGLQTLLLRLFMFDALSE